ncbi:MAG: 3'-5' exonuclease, partial [Saprospiraceae bacterium]|nr:3'-5' exonuclease [Saprospiraceae bacterium]
MVALDIETTGLDANKDAIIEIGAVRFSGHRVEAEWSKLINPGKPILPFITQLTGISNEMVRNAPPLNAVIQEFADFVGDVPVVGHNVRFDLGFLQKSRILHFNKVIDTYERAAVALPCNSRYNLGTLGSTLGSLIPNSHRALDDAKLTHAVLHALYQKLLELPIEILAETVRLSESIDWDGAYMFQQALREKGRLPVEAKKVYQEDYGALFGGAVSLPPLIPVETPEPLNVDEMAAMIEHGGP